MAEFCSQCSPYKEQKQWDFDLFKIALGLDTGRAEGFICEGCDNRGVYKDESGKIYIIKERGKDFEFVEVKIEELMV